MYSSMMVSYQVSAKIQTFWVNKFLLVLHETEIWRSLWSSLALCSWRRLWVLHYTSVWKFHLFPSGDYGVPCLQGRQGLDWKQGRGNWSTAGSRKSWFMRSMCKHKTPLLPSQSVRNCRSKSSRLIYCCKITWGCSYISFSSEKIFGAD